MKDPLKLQTKLYQIVSKNPGLRLNLTAPPWGELEFSGISHLVERYVRESGEVVNDDPLHEWLEEYQFYLTQKPNGKSSLVEP